MDEPWREAIWRAVPAGAEPERFAARRAFLLAHVRGGERVLDLGAGDGAFAAELVRAGCEVIAVDVAAEAEVLEHVADVVGLLADVRRVLRWGGTLVATTPYHGRLSLLAVALRDQVDEHFDPRADHLRFFTARSLCALLLETGFADAEVRAVGGLPGLRAGLHAVAR